MPKLEPTYRLTYWDGRHAEQDVQYGDLCVAVESAMLLAGATGNMVEVRDHKGVSVARCRWAPLQGPKGRARSA